MAHLFFWFLPEKLRSLLGIQPNWARVRRHSQAFSNQCLTTSKSSIIFTIFHYRHKYKLRREKLIQQEWELPQYGYLQQEYHNSITSWFTLKQCEYTYWQSNIKLRCAQLQFESPSEEKVRTKWTVFCEQCCRDSGFIGSLTQVTFYYTGWENGALAIKDAAS